jgi:hypothetical protein
MLAAARDRALGRNGWQNDKNPRTHTNPASRYPVRSVFDCGKMRARPMLAPEARLLRDGDDAERVARHGRVI